MSSHKGKALNSYTVERKSEFYNLIENRMINFENIWHWYKVFDYLEKAEEMLAHLKK